MTEYWNEQLTKASWKKLQELSKKYDFILIGGWAAYLWTNKNKSKDIDIVVDFKTLEKFRKDFDLKKNDRLKKYEVRMDKFDIDVYVPHYSDLNIPLHELDTTRIQGIKTVSIEELLILKQGAEIDRRGTVKGKKDSIDVLTLLIHGEIDVDRYHDLLEKYGLENYEKELKKVVKEFSDDDIKFLGIGFQEFKNWKKKFLEELKK